MKVALVYDRVNKWGGAERVLLALHEIFPEAPLYTAVYSPTKARWAKLFPKVIPSFLQKLPLAKDRHEYLGGLMPLAFESFDFADYDLVISVTSEAAKGVIIRPPTRHICYCLTPTRYLWSGYATYFSKDSFLRSLSGPVVGYLRRWDRVAAQRPDIIVAISSAVRKRIKRYYQRDSIVLRPPVDISFIQKSSPNTSILYSNEVESRSPFFLIVARLVSYKRVDLAVAAFNKLGLPLIIVGKGNEEGRLKRMAKSNVKFVGELTDAKLADYYRRCTALIFPQEEDFGLVAVEAQAAGAPVIAFKAGGALYTVIEGKTGVFFDKQTVGDLIKAVDSLKEIRFEKQDMVENAKRFSKERFKEEFLKLI